MRNLANRIHAWFTRVTTPSDDAGLGLVELLIGGAVLILIVWVLFRR